MNAITEYEKINILQGLSDWSETQKDFSNESVVRKYWSDGCPTVSSIRFAKMFSGCY